jgi:uncharacterized membrane protein
MANIINKSNHLEDKLNLEIEKEAKHQKKVRSTMINILAAVFLITIVVKSLFSILLLLITISAVCVVIFFSFMGKECYGCEHLRSGIKGEKLALEVLSKLDSDYSIISDLEIEYDGKKSQIDSVIVGCNGIFVMETKNVKGYIV